MKKILLIEDNSDIRETTGEILELADYDVIYAENGKVGVAKAKEEHPDLIICDIMMPDLDGYGVLKIVGRNPDTSSIPFIFLTAKAEKSDVRMGMNLGADDYITKPFEETELLNAVETRLERNESFKKDYGANLQGLDEFIGDASGIEDLKDLSKNRKVKRYKKKEVIYREDDFSNFLYLINKGKVKCVKTDFYGKDFVNDIHGEGEFIGYVTILEEGEYHETAIAMEETEVAVIPRQDFLKLIQKNRDVATRFIKMLSGNVKDREKRLLELAYAPVRERVANSLLTLLNKERQAKGDEVEAYNISREDLASIVGTAKESLNRMMSEFKKEGLINTTGQHVIILNEKGLKDVASQMEFAIGTK